MTPAHALVHGLEPQGETCQYSKSPPCYFTQRNSAVTAFINQCSWNRSANFVNDEFDNTCLDGMNRYFHGLYPFAVHQRVATSQY